MALPNRRYSVNARRPIPLRGGKRANTIPRAFNRPDAAAPATPWGAASRPGSSGRVRRRRPTRCAARLRLLRRSDLHDQAASGLQPVGRASDEAVEDREAVRPSVQGRVRLVVANAGRQGGEVGVGDVRRVAEDEIEALAGWERSEQVAFEKADALGDAVFGRVAGGHGQRRRAHVHRRDLGRFAVFGDRHRQAAGSRTDV